MRKSSYVITAVLLIVLAQFIISAPVRKLMRMQLNTDYLRAMGAYRRLESRLARKDLRMITTIGILNGARQAELEMERNLVGIVKELLRGVDLINDDELILRVQNIEKQLRRDHRALLILTDAFDLATGAKNVDDFKTDMQQTLQQIRRQSEGELSVHDEEDLQQNTGAKAKNEDINEAAERVAALRRQIIQQVRAMKTLVEEKVTQTLDYLIAQADENSLLGQASKKVLRKRDVVDVREVPAEVRVINSVLKEEDFRNNLVETHLEMRNNVLFNDSLEDDFELNSDGTKSRNAFENRSSSSNSLKQSSDPLVVTTTTTATTTTVHGVRATKSQSTRAAATSTTTVSPSTEIVLINATIDTHAKQEEGIPKDVPPVPIEEEEEFPNAPPPADGGGGGGLVGIITSLSGGEGGSDIGALIGALTGVISTLFGPGGLDIESLISTATSLISGLLAGNKNFGTVLGIYIGTAFDGLSGGGGAVNNGQFLGNLLGTVYAQLSADPEDDDSRPNPFLFARNLISSFVEAKNRKESDEEGDDERRSDARHSHGNKNKGDAGGGGSDSGGFIKHIASHIVGSLVSLLLNASLGASGGASHASASLFGSSSHKGNGGGGAGNGYKY